MGAGAVAGQQPVQAVVTERDLMNKIMSCEACAIQFTIFKRKKICCECKRQFCGNCLPREPQKKEGRQCQKCRILISGNFNRELLQDWKVKDIRCFLNTHNIPTTMCREKHDLIELVLSHYSRIAPLSNDSEHERIVQQLTERMRQDAEPETTTTTDNDVTDNSNHSNTDTAQPQQEASGQESVQRMYLKNIGSLEEIDALSVRQLKEVLANNFVDYKGCCEKTELIDRVKRLWTEKQKNKAKVEVMRENAEKCKSSGEQDLCKICMDASVDCVLLECGHMLTCTECGKRLAECPICRQYVARVVHTFRS